MLVQHSPHYSADVSNQQAVDKNATLYQEAKDAFRRGDDKLGYETLRPLLKQAFILQNQGQDAAALKLYTDIRQASLVRGLTDNFMRDSSKPILSSDDLVDNEILDVALKCEMEGDMASAKNIYAAFIEENNPLANHPNDTWKNFAHPGATARYQGLQSSPLTSEKDLQSLLQFKHTAGGLYYLGKAYLHGSHGAPRCLVTAAQYFKQAHHHGHVPAKFDLENTLGQMTAYEQGQWNENHVRDSQTALTHYEKGANSGDRQAQSRLGMAYLNGELTLKKDETRGIDCLIKSAEQGHTEAAAKLEVIYRAKDNEERRKLFSTFTYNGSYAGLANRYQKIATSGERYSPQANSSSITQQPPPVSLDDI